MAELDPRIQRVRRIGIGVFIALAVLAIPVAIHIIQTRDSPELWLSLLGAVFMMVLICLYALETALSPIPDRKFKTPQVIASHEDTVIQDETLLDEAPEIYATTEMLEPALGPDLDGSASKDVASLVEVEEIPTHPPFSGVLGSDLSEQATELDPDRARMKNPDGPVMTVPNPSLRNTDSDPGDEGATETSEDAPSE
jgi:hypothetical protein